MNIFLVRHGESVWNREQRIQGREDPGLSEKGQRQAKALARRLKKENVEIIYTSGLKRCVQTARMIAKETGASMKVSSGIEEIILGDWQGRTVEEVKKIYPKVYEAWLKAPSRANIPGWEGIRRFTKRVDSAFKSILNNNSASCICVVTHLGVIAAYLSRALDTDFDLLFRTIRMDNCGLSKFSHRDGRSVMQFINDTRHLK
ncbi:MAG: histidine phosphatase family protein [Candidatus Omnitrophota bacterium]|nr:histidine phosphatase family protein [Candidatus Omnitrophota bacterium]